MAMEQGRVTEFEGKSLDQIQIEPEGILLLFLNGPLQIMNVIPNYRPEADFTTPLLVSSLTILYDFCSS
uniref:Uncharacterized protein n=1 Tax=Knipowitschia caucasica TaxID=637954 RepID=A0AAV2JEM1_KNICA